MSLIFDQDDRQPKDEALLTEGMHFGLRRHRRIGQGTMEAMSYDAAMPVSPRDPAMEWRTIDEGGWVPLPAGPDQELVEALKKIFPDCPAAAVMAGVSLFVTLLGYGGPGAKKSA